MNPSRHGRTIVVGLGNPVLSDDRAGLAVAESLQRLIQRHPLPDVDVLTATRGGFHLIDVLHGYARAFLIDCYTPPNPTPGRVLQLDLSHAAGSARLINAHEISAAEAFQFAALLSIPMPADVTIYAIEAADTATISELMTPLVQAAVEPLARHVRRLLSRPESALASRRSAGIPSDAKQPASTSRTREAVCRG